MDQIKAFAKEFKKTEAASYISSLSTKVKQMALNLTDLEVKVEEATNNEPWGPHGSVMAEISEAAYDAEGYRQIMGVVARRLQDTGELWRHVYKSLLLLEYMLKHGPQKVVQELSSNIVVIEKLQSFQYKDKNLRDHGENVRHRAKQLCELVLDPERVRSERKKAKELKSKYTGVSSDMMRSGRSGGGGGLGGGGGSGGRRTYYDDEDEDDIYAPRNGSGSGDARGDRGAIGQSSRGDADPMEATRARIEAIRARDAVGKGEEDEDAAPTRQGRKLSTMRVDPKVSASLGLKAPTPTAAPAPRPAAAAKAQEIDLMGGLDDESAAPAPAARASADAWNAFESAEDSAAAAPAPAADDTNGASWADFSSAPSQPAKAADPVADLFALDAAPAAAKPEPAAAPAAADPFGDFGSAPPAAAGPAVSTVPKPSTGPAPKAALPEDVFSELPPPPPAYPSPQSSSYGAPQAAGGQYLQQQPQQAGFGFTAPQAVGAYGQQQGYGVRQQLGGQASGSFGALQQPGGQLGASGALPASFGAPQQQQPPQQQGYGGLAAGGSASADLEPQLHVGDLGLTGKGAAGQRKLGGGGGGSSDPFAGLGF